MATSPVSNSHNEFFVSLMPPFPWTALPSDLEPTEKPDTTPTPPAQSAVACVPVEDKVASNAPADRNQLLVEHIPLVRYVARKIHERLPQHVEMDDLVSAGTLGLIDALNKFDAGKKVQFRSYAQFRIRGAILDGLRDLDWGSRELRRKGRNVEEARQKLSQQLGRKATENEIATELGISLKRYQDLLGSLKGLEIGSLHEMRGEDSVEEELAYIPAAPEEDPLHRCMQTEMLAQLNAAISDLPEREARVLSLYYIEEMTLKEIGVVLGLVESRVSQIRAAAVANLRMRMTRRLTPMVRPGKMHPVPLSGRQTPVPVAMLRKNVSPAAVPGRMRAAR